MKRYVAATAMLAMVMTLGSSGMAQAAGRRHIRPGGVWTLTVGGGGCEVQTFGSGHTWVSDRFGDAGTYTGGLGKITETFSMTSGDAGAVFKGPWEKSDLDYKGTITFSDASTASATLTKGATCPPPV